MKRETISSKQNTLFKGAASACKRLLNASHVRVIKPPPVPTGIRYRRRNMSSVRVAVEGKTLIATRRSNPVTARTEAMVLAKLQKENVSIPRLIAFDQVWMLHEDVGHKSLPTVLAGSNEKEGAVLLDKALGSLLEIQQAGARVYLVDRLPEIIAEEILFRSPAIVGEILGIPPPVLSSDARSCLNAGKFDKFIKGDARPGNAIVTPSGCIAWIDWEHTGRGNPLSDLEWLLADEWIPDWPDVEAHLIEKYHGMYNSNGPDQLDYLWTLGTLHMLARLSAILKYKGDGPWWNQEVCMTHELFGVTHQCATRLCMRAARWAARSTNTNELATWLEGLRFYIPRN